MVLRTTGMVPVSEFVLRTKLVVLAMVLSSTGMVPVSEFVPKLREVMLVIVLSSTGMIPVRLFQLKVLQKWHINVKRNWMEFRSVV